MDEKFDEIPIDALEKYINLSKEFNTYMYQQRYSAAKKIDDERFEIIYKYYILKDYRFNISELLIHLRYRRIKEIINY
jgi:hypothetical protein